MPLFEVRGLTHFFGGLKAVSNFNLTFEGGELMGLIGPNGGQNHHLQFGVRSLPPDSRGSDD